MAKPRAMGFNRLGSTAIASRGCRLRRLDRSASKLRSVTRPSGRSILPPRAAAGATAARQRGKIEAFLKFCETFARGAILHLEHSCEAARAEAKRQAELARQIAEIEADLRLCGSEGSGGSYASFRPRSEQLDVCRDIRPRRPGAIRQRNAGSLLFFGALTTAENHEPRRNDHSPRDISRPGISTAKFTKAETWNCLRSSKSRGKKHTDGRRPNQLGAYASRNST